MRVLFLLTLAVGALAAPLAAVSSDGETAAQEPCCFANPRYVGICEEIPEADETCDTILGYLNNPNSAGKDYCDSTDIRGGWAEVSCEAGDGSAASEPENPPR